MLIALWIYIFFMLALGITSYFNVKSYKDFTLAGAKGSTTHITFSLLASMIGSSATFGMVALTQKHGFPAFWWLGAGAFFLTLQALFLAKPVRKLNAYSLPDVARKVISEKASFYISFIISISWIGIIAAQFIALGQIVSIMIDGQNTQIFITIIGILITLYAFLGGQLSIIRTDSYQFILLFSAVLLIFILLYFTEQYATFFSKTSLELNFSQLQLLSFDNIIHNLSEKFQLFNETFSPSDLLYLALVAGLAFFVGPDIFTRNFAAKNAEVAQRATFISAFILLFFSIIISYIALWILQVISSGHLPADSSQNLLIILIKNFLPIPLGTLFAIGLISALISSADTCLMSCAVILSHDIFKNKNIKQTRIFILLIGTIALCLALFKGDIIALLIGAYSVYVPGVVFPLAFSIYFYTTCKLNPQLLFLAILSGSILGLCSNLLQMPNLALYGILCSALLSLASFIYRKKIITKNILTMST